MFFSFKRYFKPFLQSLFQRKSVESCSTEDTNFSTWMQQNLAPSCPRKQNYSLRHNSSRFDSNAFKAEQNLKILQFWKLIVLVSFYSFELSGNITVSHKSEKGSCLVIYNSCFVDCQILNKCSHDRPTSLYNNKSKLFHVESNLKFQNPQVVKNNNSLNLTDIDTILILDYRSQEAQRSKRWISVRRSRNFYKKSQLLPSQVWLLFVFEQCSPQLSA